MAGNENPPEPISNLQTFFSFLQEMLVKLCDFIGEFWRKSGNIGQSNYELGRQMMSRGEMMDAVFRFRIALWFNPRHMQAWYHLGQCELARGKRAEAIAAFRRAYALNHNHEETRYMLTLMDPAAVMNESPPTTMPLSLVALQFDAASRNYNIRQEQIGYQGHSALTAALLAVLPFEATDLRILDLGCGSGLVGPLMRSRASYLAGVDASQGMLREAYRLRDAEGRQIYDQLFYVDLKQYLSQPPQNPYDVIIAANVLGYVGELNGVFSSIYDALAPGGLFAFSVHVDDKPGFHIVPGLGRFAYSLDYLHAQAVLHGWQEIVCENTQLTAREKATQFIFKRPHAAASAPLSDG